jgi:hypothetical protein
VRRKPDHNCCDLIGLRRFIRGASRGCKVRFSQGDIIDSAVDAKAGRLAEADTDQPRNQGSGQLERRRIGERQETRDLGQPGNWSIAVAKGGCPGKPGDATKANRMVRDPRRLGYQSAGTGGFGVWGNLNNESSAIPNGWARGNSRTGNSAPPKDAKVGATRQSIAGKAGGAG